MTDEKEIKTTLNNQDQFIALDVGGSSYFTSVVTLKRSPYFKKLFANEDNIEVLQNDEIYIGRDGDLFGDILEYLRSDKIYSTTNLLSELKYEAEFYQLEEMAQRIESMLQEEAAGKKKNYELIEFEDLKKSACLDGEKDTCITKSLSSMYEFISIVKINQPIWYCVTDRATHSFEEKQKNWGRYRNCSPQLAMESEEKLMLLVARKISKR